MSSSSTNRHGAETNTNGGLYIRGRAHDVLIKLQVADEYKAAAAAKGGTVRPNISKIAKKCQVSEYFVGKIERELLAYNGSVLSPEEIRANANRQRGPGAYTLTNFDCFVLYRLYVEQPYRVSAVTGTGCFTSPAQMSVRTQYLGSSKKDFLTEAA